VGEMATAPAPVRRDPSPLLVASKPPPLASKALQLLRHLVARSLASSRPLLARSQSTAVAWVWTRVGGFDEPLVF
jgi:hypothetical protein